jgi:hypothetical protein
MKNTVYLLLAFCIEIIQLQNYKPPGVKDIPIDFRVHLRRKAPNPFGVLRSKGSIYVTLPIIHFLFN